jgi:hypothetical protein
MEIFHLDPFFDSENQKSLLNVIDLILKSNPKKNDTQNPKFLKLCTYEFNDKETNLNLKNSIKKITDHVIEKKLISNFPKNYPVGSLQCLLLEEDGCIDEIYDYFNGYSIIITLGKYKTKKNFI